MNKFVYPVIAVLLLFSCKKENIGPTEEFPCSFADSSASHPKNALFASIIDSYIHKGLPGISVLVEDSDGTWVGFFAGTSLKKVLTAGGPVVEKPCRAVPPDDGWFRKVATVRAASIGEDAVGEGLEALRLDTSQRPIEIRGVCACEAWRQLAGGFSYVRLPVEPALPPERQGGSRARRRQREHRQMKPEGPWPQAARHVRWRPAHGHWPDRAGPRTAHRPPDPRDRAGAASAGQAPDPPPSPPSGPARDRRSARRADRGRRSRTWTGSIAVPPSAPSACRVAAYAPRHFNAASVMVAEFPPPP